MPSLGMLTINALAAADSVVITTQPHYLSAKGMELLLALLYGYQGNSGNLCRTYQQGNGQNFPRQYIPVIPLL